MEAAMSLKLSDLGSHLSPEAAAFLGEEILGQSVDRIRGIVVGGSTSFNFVLSDPIMNITLDAAKVTGPNVDLAKVPFDLYVVTIAANTAGTMLELHGPMHAGTAPWSYFQSDCKSLLGPTSDPRPEALNSMLGLSAAAHFTREVELNSMKDWDREDVEGHSEQVSQLIFKAIEAYRQITAENQGSGFMTLMHPDPLIEEHSLNVSGLNPRALVMLAQYYTFRGEVEKGFGYNHLALFRAKADMNCCAVFDCTVWGYLHELGDSVTECAKIANSTFATSLHNRGWSTEKMETSAGEELACVDKAAKAWAVEHEGRIIWTYDRRWCLFYNSEWQKWKNAPGRVIRTAMEEKLKQDFGFDGSRDRQFRVWTVKSFASETGVGPQMSDDESATCVRIFKASAQGAKQLPFPSSMHSMHMDAGQAVQVESGMPACPPPSYDESVKD